MVLGKGIHPWRGPIRSPQRPNSIPYAVAYLIFRNAG